MGERGVGVGGEVRGTSEDPLANNLHFWYSFSDHEPLILWGRQHRYGGSAVVLTYPFTIKTTCGQQLTCFLNLLHRNYTSAFIEKMNGRLLKLHVSDCLSCVTT